jgi:ferredoxin
MQIFGSKELIEDVHQRGLCIGCGACVDLCPYFKNYKGKTSQLFPCTLEQGRCYAYCPKAEVDLDALTRQTRNLPYDGSPLGSYQTVRAARAGKKLPPGDVQAGGTVTALMTFAMQKGLLDAAALTDRQSLTPVPRLVTDWQDVAGCATSKFMAAPTLAALNTAVREGYRRIGVVGTPCQITALAQMRGNPLEKAEYNVPLAFLQLVFGHPRADGPVGRQGGCLRNPHDGYPAAAGQHHGPANRKGAAGGFAVGNQTLDSAHLLYLFGYDFGIGRPFGGHVRGTTGLEHPDHPLGQRCRHR